MNGTIARMTWTLRIFLGLWLLSPLSCAVAAGHPNVLVILVDDLGYGDVGAYGATDVSTPHIDALAASGVRCTNGYVTAPICGPSRAGLLTGRYQTRFGFEHNPRAGDEETLGLPLAQRTLADRLREAGYATGIVGKWHLGFAPKYQPQERGFDDFFGFLVAMHNYKLRDDKKPQFEAAYSRNMLYRGREVVPCTGYTTDVFVDEALAFMQGHAG